MGSPSYRTLALPNNVFGDDPPGYADLYDTAEILQPFPFAPIILDFLLGLNVSPRGITLVSDALSYEPRNWITLFVAAGLNPENATILKEIILASPP